MGASSILPVWAWCIYNPQYNTVFNNHDLTNTHYRGEETHRRWRNTECDVLIEAKVVAFFFLVSVFIFHFLLHVTTNRSNTPASNTPTPLECTLTPLKKEEKKGLRDQWTGMSVYALIHAVHASVGKATLKVSPAVVHLLGHTHTQRVWRSHTKPEGLILPPAHVIQTHLFKAIVVLFVWFLWSRALCEHCCVFFCYCVRACVCVKVVSVCKKYKIKNGLWDCEQYTVPYIPRNVLRCQYNHSKTAISRSEEWETYDSSCVCM